MAPPPVATVSAVAAATGVFIALMLQLQDGDEIIKGGFDGCYTYFASDQVSQASQPANWPAIAR
jgi:glycoprotein endo-alpha-1,2-mannosidase